MTRKAEENFAHALAIQIREDRFVVPSVGLINNAYHDTDNRVVVDIEQWRFSLTIKQEERTGAHEAGVAVAQRAAVADIFEDIVRWAHGAHVPPDENWIEHQAQIVRDHCHWPASEDKRREEALAKLTKDDRVLLGLEES